MKIILTFKKQYSSRNVLTEVNVNWLTSLSYFECV